MREDGERMIDRRDEAVVLVGYVIMCLWMWWTGGPCTWGEAW